jgi:hypothetical protein
VSFILFYYSHLIITSAYYPWSYTTTPFSLALLKSLLSLQVDTGANTPKLTIMLYRTLFLALLVGGAVSSNTTATTHCKDGVCGGVCGDG